MFFSWQLIDLLFGDQSKVLTVYSSYVFQTVNESNNDNKRMMYTCSILAIEQIKEMLQLNVLYFKATYCFRRMKNYFIFLVHTS